MLQIYIHGEIQSGFLDLPADIKLDVESFADIFAEDEALGTYSLPVDIPYTATNRRLLGFAERLKNNNSSPKWYKCTVYETGWPVMIGAKFTILEKAGSLNYQSGKFSASISGNRGLFGSTIKDKKLVHLILGGPITFPTKTSREFAEDVMKGNEPAYSFLGFAPLAIENFFDESRKDYDGEFLARDTVNTAIQTGAGANDWTFGRPSSSNPNSPVAATNAEYIDYRTVPFLNYKFVIGKCFEEMGFTLIGDWFAGNTNFDALYIFNNCSVEDYAVSNYTDQNHTITPTRHLPDLLISEFLKRTFAFFCLYPVFNGTEVKLVYRKNHFANRTVFSLGSIAENQYVASPKDADNQQGYSINFTWDSNDQYYGDRVKDITTKTLAATVATFANLGTLNIGRTLTTDDIAYVEADNLYYCVADATGSPIKWDAWAEALGPYKVGNGDRAVDLPISTLCTYVEFNTGTALWEKQPYLGCRQAGSYINNKGITVQSPFDLRLFYIKRQNLGAGPTVPVSFYHNRNNAGQIIMPYSLALTGNFGIAESFHKQWQNLQQGMEIVKINVAASPQMLKQMLTNNFYELNGVLFMPYKIEHTRPVQGRLQVQMVPV